MDSFYAAMRLVHLCAVLLSGTLFFSRGMAAAVFGAAWPQWSAVRTLTWTIDTILLAAALMLTTMVHQYPFIDGWLTMKVVLLVIYVGLGTYAFRGKTQNIRLGAFVAALGVFALIAAVARAHSPLGPFA